MAVRPVRRSTRALVAVALVSTMALGALFTGCTGDSEPAPQAGGALPTPSDPDTLLPVPEGTDTPDPTVSLPPDLLFGGELCAALTADDVRGVRFGSSASARLDDTVKLSEDSCQFLLTAGGSRWSVVVKARSQPDFVTPAPGGETVEELPGPGLLARGVQFDDRYEVTVKVPNGYFAVVAPTRDAALALAAKAVPRVDQPPPPTTLDLPVPADTGVPSASSASDDTATPSGSTSKP